MPSELARLPAGDLDANALDEDEGVDGAGAPPVAVEGFKCQVSDRVYPKGTMLQERYAEEHAPALVTTRVRTCLKCN